MFPLQHSNSLQVRDDKILRTLINLDNPRRTLLVGPHNLVIGNGMLARQVAAGVIAPVYREVDTAVDMEERERHAVVGAGGGCQVGDGLVAEGGAGTDDGLGGADGHVEVVAAREG